ncbi:hypothetical protein [Curtobacterium sp. 9128]|uniref:hypothetical protein n=1 Tax=Curtobacterium sp. 9128 TaxID=1793722 RepID=UPI0011A6639C|nr:hypothetical protein [Curtobacterium sp. 9128]
MTSAHPYLRRRRRPAAVPAAAQDVAPPAPVIAPSAAPDRPRAGGSLTLSAPTASRPAAAAGRASGATPTAQPVAGGASNATRTGHTAGGPGPSERVAERLRRRAARPTPFPAPRPQDVRVLGTEDPVVRLDRRQSAVGVLRVSGATSVVWESEDHVVGAETVEGARAGRDVPTSGNRPLVGFHDGDVLVSLRHVRELRRALVMARGDDRPVVTLQDGTTIAIEAGSADVIPVLALSVIDGALELRAEPFPRASHDGDVFAAFGFVLSAPTNRP